MTPSARLAMAIRRFARFAHLGSIEMADAEIAAKTGLQSRRVSRLRRGLVRMYVEDCDQLAAVLDCRAEWIAFGVSPPQWARVAA